MCNVWMNIMYAKTFKTELLYGYGIVFLWWRLNERTTNRFLCEKLPIRLSDNNFTILHTFCFFSLIFFFGTWCRTCYTYMSLIWLQLHEACEIFVEGWTNETNNIHFGHKTQAKFCFTVSIQMFCLPQRHINLF